MAKIGAYANYIKAKNKLINEAEIKDKNGKGTGYYIGSNGKITGPDGREVKDKEKNKDYQAALDALSDQEKHEEESNKLNSGSGADISDRTAATAVANHAGTSSEKIKADDEQELNPENVEKAQEENDSNQEDAKDREQPTEPENKNTEEANKNDKEQATKPEIQKKENDDTDIKSLSDNAKQVSHFDATESTFGEYLNKFCKNVLAVLKQGDVGSESTSDVESTTPSSTEVKESE